MIDEAKFVKNKTYYTGIVYEFNLPTGSTCPMALECLVKVDRYTGKFNIKKGAYRCYASSAERFPGVRERRWKNFDFVKNGKEPILPSDCKAVRIHMSGDFFNQSYFDMWVNIAIKNPNIEFWAYTKSLEYWVNRLNLIPNNLELTASVGGRQDYLIAKYNLKFVEVYQSKNNVPIDMPIDCNDDCARNKSIKKFALLDNTKNSKKLQNESRINQTISY